MQTPLRSFRRLLAVAAATCSVALGGCLLPQAYRVTPAAGGAGLQVEAPNVYRTSEGLRSVLYFPDRGPSAKCPLRAEAGGIVARGVGAARGGRVVTAIRFDAGEAVFATPAALQAALGQWWADEATKSFRQCYELSQEASVRRSLLAQRPQSAAELLDAQFAFDAGRDPKRLRTIFLRPGMRICATDVAPEDDTRTPRYWIAQAPSCTRIAGAPDGGLLFDPVAGRFDSLTMPSINYGLDEKGDAHRVASWSEIRRPIAGPHAWLVVFPQCPRCMPTTYDSSPPPYHDVPLLVGIRLDAGEGATPSELVELTSPAPGLPSLRIATVCAKSNVLCYRFGERAMFTVEFTVFVNGAAQDVAIGTTLGDIAAMVSPDLFSRELVSPAGWASGVDEAARSRARLNLSRLKMQRVFDGRLAPVDLSRAGADAYALPLQPGDRLNW